MPTTTASAMAIRTIACPLCLFSLSPFGRGVRRELASPGPAPLGGLSALSQRARERGPEKRAETRFTSVLGPEDRRRGDHDSICRGLRDHWRDQDQVEPDRDLQRLVSTGGVHCAA